MFTSHYYIPCNCINLLCSYISKTAVSRYYGALCIYQFTNCDHCTYEYAMQMIMILKKKQHDKFIKLKIEKSGCEEYIYLILFLTDLFCI